MAFTFEKTKIPGVMIIQPQVFGDSRGYFMESFKAPDFFRPKRMTAAITAPPAVETRNGTMFRITRVVVQRVSCVVFIFKRTIHRGSLSVLLTVKYLMWLWMSDPDRKPTGSGLA